MATSFTALTTLTGLRAGNALSDALETLIPAPTGVGVFEVEDGSGLWEVGGYFTNPPDTIALDLLAAAFGARPFRVSELPEIDWVAKVKRDLPAVRAGRFFVYGPHDADKLPEEATPLLIISSMAFGTGHHGTTLGCLLALERLKADGFVARNVADIGCGTAVLAMAAALVWPGVILASDIDAQAIEVARANTAANDLGDRVCCVEAAGFDAPEFAQKAPFDLVFANILKGPLIGLGPDMAASVVAGGYVILSGILNEQADDVIKVYARYGFNLCHRDSIVDWTTLTLIKKWRK